VSFSLEAGAAGKVTFRFKYPGPAKPTDYHIYLIDPAEPELKHARRLIDANVIPDGQDPLAGIELPYYPGSPAFPMEGGRLKPGTYVFALVWSFHGERPDELDGETPALFRTGDGPGKKPWDWVVFAGKALGGALASGVSGAALNWWTVVALLPCILTGIMGGLAGGMFGYIFVWLFDDPRIRWGFRSAFLFVLFYTLAFSMVLGLLAIDLEVTAAERGELVNRVTLGVSVISAFLAACLAGVLNNLRDGREG